MTEIVRTTPIGLARYAREYFDAALAADDVIGRRKGYETSAPPPVMFLVAHSIELALKAYLLDCGLTLEKVTSIGHNLITCWSEADKRDLGQHVSLTGVDFEVLNLINTLHVSTELRYIRAGYKEVPAFGPLQTLAEKLLNTICPLVGYR